MSFEDQIKLLIGGYIFQITQLKVIVEKLQAENAELREQLKDKDNELRPSAN